MENHRSGRSAGDIVAKIQNGNSENNVSETMAVRTTNQTFLATKEGMSNGKAYVDYESKPNDRRKLFQPELGSSPLFPDSTPSDRSKAIGDMFYKTKLCCEFEVGNCLFMDKCDFAHGIEELRKRPIYGEELFDSSKQREIFRVQSSLFVDEDVTEEGCEYGKKYFSFRNGLDEDRKSEAICLLPGNESNSFTKDSNWKTRICHKWELSGWCPYGEKCHFAHGYAELRGYGGELVNLGSGNSSAQPSIHGVGGSASVIPRRWNRDQRPATVAQMAREAPARRWKGPDKISKIYGDWIDDL